MSAERLLSQLDFASPAGCAAVRGFNYQPSWGADGLSIWGKFDPARYRFELERGRELFPPFNTVRIWLSWSAYKADPAAAAARVAQAIAICGELDLLVMPVLFMRWIGRPAFDPVRFADIDRDDLGAVFGPFVDDVVRPQRGNRRILAWDLCNEPSELPDQLHWYGETAHTYERVMEVQYRWLRFVRERIRALDPAARTCVGTIGWAEAPETKAMWESLGELVTPHLYDYAPWYFAGKPGTMADFFEALVARFMADQRARGVSKPVINTEAFWGAVDDRERAGMVATSLATLRRHGIGYLAYGLWASPVSDLHPAELGPVGGAGNMCFVNPDGALRPGHDVFNAGE